MKGWTRWLGLLVALPTILVASDDAAVLDRFQVLTCARYSFYETDHFWNSKGHKINSFNNFKRYRGDACMAFGITNYDTLQLQGSYNRINESANGSINGFDDIELSWKHYFGRKWCHYFTGRLLAVIPVGGRELSLRYGRWGGEADLFVRRDFGSVWYDLGAGYRMYQGYPSDQVRGYFDIGWTPFRCFSLLADSQLYYGVYNGHGNDPANLILYNANYRLLNGRLYGVLQLHRYLYVYGGVSRHLWGRNVGAGGGFFAGAYILF